MRRAGFRRWALVSLALVMPATMLTSCNLPAGFQQQVVAGGFNLPTTWVSPNASTHYVAEKSGVIRVATNGTVRSTPLVDLRGRVNDIGDRGLIGMALDPNFATNGLLYLAYTYEDPTLRVDALNQTQRVTRIVVDRGTHTADPATEHVVLGNVTGAACYDHWETPDCLPSNIFVHTVDDLAFDPAGALWVSVGDGAWFPYTGAAVSYRAQNTNVLAGKLLRIDPETGLGVAGNPFFEEANPTSNRSRVYAYGFRNPFRFSFRPGSGVPYVGDVGGDGRNSTEEINVVQPGGNYGWPCYEGAAKQSRFASEAVCQPMYQAATPVIGPAASYVHSDQGTSITGGVFYSGTSNYPADYVGNYIYGDYNAFVRRQKFTSANVTSGGAINFVAKAAAGAPVKVAIGPDGNLWYLSIYPGELRRLVYNGEKATTPTTTSPTGSAPAVAVTSPANLVRVADRSTVTFTATANDAEDGTLPPSAVTIDVTYRHYSSGTFHHHPYQTTSGTSGSFVASTAHGPGHYRITARATDSDGNTTTSPAVNVCLVGYNHGSCA